MGINKIGCDCREREAKKWLLESPHTLRWRVICIDEVTSQMKPLKDIPWSDLTCSAPEVSVLLDSPGMNVAENISVICQTNCEESLTFSWILPSGEHRSSDYRYSTNYTRVRTMSCERSGVEISETKRMCHSVLNIPVADNTTAGNYTCRVATNYTESATASVILTISNATRLLDTVATTGLGNINRSTAKTTTVMYLVTFFCCGVMSGLTICVIKRGSVSNEDGGQGNTVEGHYENDDQFSDGNDNANRHYENDDQHPDPNNDANRHYENDDQFPDSNNDTNRHYENDDQFSDGNDDANRHYENDDQFSDSNNDTNRHYENDDQFSDGNDDANRHYENDDQFSDSDNDTNRHYENDDQFSDGCDDANRHYENDDQFSDSNNDTNKHYENDDQFSDGNDATRHYENDDLFSDSNNDTNGHYENNDQFQESNNDSNKHYENKDGNGDSQRHYENDDQFPDTNKVTVRHYENDDQFSSEIGATVRSEENGDQFSDEEGTLEGHYGNEIGAESSFKASPRYEAPVAVQEMTSGLYNTDSREEQ
ncbi:stress protein DDR48-like [Branchiostoma floridae]|uniref:Stress protein DDR48-like n=1 Tax=Branchiostoma floridae TaxID=7739 RepID=A0A9J7HLR3_BRAFL|nr:stress protein DDR48-like [Branchiostoma floridae]